MPDNPFDGGLVADHRYQIGDTPVFLSVAMEQGKPRLSFLMTQSPSGEVYDPPVRVHLATFMGERQALATVQFLDQLLSCVNKAVAHYEQLCTPDLTQLTAQEPKHGSQN